MAEAQPIDTWRDWMKAAGGRLWLFARQQTRCEADAQDVFQDAMVRLWNNGSRRLGGQPPALAEAFAAIRRCAIDLARKETSRQHREHAYDQEISEPVVWFQSTLESEERTQAISEALRRIPAIYQEVVVLKVWGGLTFAEIAGALDIPLNTAASRYRYGLAGLRKHLQVSIQ